MTSDCCGNRGMLYLEDKVRTLTDEIGQQRDRLADERLKWVKLDSEVQMNRIDIDHQQMSIETLDVMVKKLREENAALKARVKELEADLKARIEQTYELNREAMRKETRPLTFEAVGGTGGIDISREEK